MILTYFQEQFLEHLDVHQFLSIERNRPPERSKVLFYYKEKISNKMGNN